MEETIKILMRRIDDLEKKVTYLTTLENTLPTPEDIGALSLTNGGTVLNSIENAASYTLVYPLNLNRRWVLNATGTETGSNTGSNLSIARYADNGSYLSLPLVIKRDTGYIIIEDRVYAAGLRSNPGSPETSELYVDASGFVKRG